jgi:hypothetical protein
LATEEQAGVVGAGEKILQSRVRNNTRRQRGVLFLETMIYYHHYFVVNLILIKPHIYDILLNENDVALFVCREL